MTRSEARMIASELYKLMREDVLAQVREAVSQECDRYIGAEEAASLLGWSVQTLYNRKEELPYFKQGKHLRFSRNSLMRHIGEGRG